MLALHKKYFISFFTIVALLLIIILYIFRSDSVSQLFVTYTANKLPGHLSISKIDGNFSSGITLSEINYEYSNYQIQAQKISLYFHRFALLRGILDIEKLDIVNAKFKLNPDLFNGEKAIIDFIPETFSPISVIVRNGYSNSIAFNANDYNTRATDVFFSAGISKKKVWWEWLNCKIKNSTVFTEGDMNLIASHHCTGNLKWRIQPLSSAQQEGNFSFESSENLSHFNLNITDPVVVETSGTFSLGKSGLILSDKKIADSEYNNTFSLSESIRTTETFSRIYFNHLTANTLGGFISIDGYLSFQGNPEFHAYFYAKNIDPSYMFPKWPGKIVFKSNISSRIDKNTPTLSINDAHFEGYLLGQSFQTSGTIELSGQSFGNVDMKFYSGKNTISIISNSTVRDTLQFNFDVPDPSNFWPPLYGHIQGAGSIKKFFEDPQMEILVTGKEIKYGKCFIKDFRSTALLNAGHSLPVKADLIATGIQLPSELYPQASIVLSSDQNMLNILATLDSNAAHTVYDFSTHSDLDVLDIIVNTASYSSEKGHEEWFLRTPLTLRLNRDTMGPIQVCWVQKDHSDSSCLDIQWQYELGLQVQGDLEIPPVTFMQIFVKKIIEAKPISATIPNS